MKGPAVMATALVRDDLPHAIEEAPNPVKEVATMAALRPRWRLIAGLVLVITTLTYLVCELITPLYATSAIVMIDPREAKRAASGADRTPMPPSEETVRKNEIAVIRSRSLAEAVIARLSLDRYPEFNPALRSTFWLHDVAEQVESLRARVTSTLLSLLTPGEPTRTTLRFPQERAADRIVDTFLDRLGTTSTHTSRVIQIRFFSASPEP